METLGEKGRLYLGLLWSIPNYWGFHRLFYDGFKNYWDILSFMAWWILIQREMPPHPWARLSPMAMILRFLVWCISLSSHSVPWLTLKRSYGCQPEKYGWLIRRGFSGFSDKLALSSFYFSQKLEWSYDLAWNHHQKPNEDVKFERMWLNPSGSVATSKANATWTADECRWWILPKGSMSTVGGTRWKKKCEISAWPFTRFHCYKSSWSQQLFVVPQM